MRRYYQGGDMQRVQSVDEMAAQAKRNLPAFAREYLLGGAEDELTLAANRASFQSLSLQSRTLVPNHPPQLQSSMLGKPSALPMAIGPTGFNGLLWPQADILLATSAMKASIPFCLSTVANASVEQVRQACPQLDFWFQLYALKDAGIQQDLLQRARDAGVDTLVITSDALVVGNREWDRRNFSAPRQLTFRNQLDVLLHPQWLRRVMLSGSDGIGLPSMGNLNPYLPAGQRSALGAMQFIAEQLNVLLSWDDLATLRAQWPGKLVLKGVLHPGDALLALDAGVDALVVSNHGGRQLDGAISSMAALGPIVEVVDGRIPVLLDSGIRRGVDVIKAISCGASGVLLGRATLFGVAAAGEAGSDRVLALLQEEMARAMNLMGCSSLAELAELNPG
ncbi:alpha-hydroxy acid oxidase [Oceanobacter kriegii]|uniref:alpha-hydroxy acid oxidase n=1 Tax=Oceanobacter kriegii TaxID=64972 RepID=UPI0004242489|nr:alpha-hydroxy acid oxidase [Oceanobacter kriegii]